MYYTLLYVFALVISIAFYNSYLIRDNMVPDTDVEDRKIKRQWHFWGAIVFVLIAIGSYKSGGYRFALLTLSLFWLLFAGIVQRVGLKTSFFFVGTTAATDKMIRSVSVFFASRKPRWLRPLAWLFGSPEGTSAILKIGFLLLSVILIILKLKR